MRVLFSKKKENKMWNRERETIVARAAAREKEKEARAQRLPEI